jgi:hypothetical protein
MYELVWSKYQPKHDIMTSFSLDKQPKISISGANMVSVTVYGWTKMPLRQHTNGSNTLYIQFWGGYQYQPQKWHNDIIFTWQMKLNVHIVSGADLAGVTAQGCTQMPLIQHTSGSTTFYISTMHVWSGLKWISAPTMTHDAMTGIIFTPQVTLDSQILGKVDQCNVIRVPPYAL